MSRILFYMKQNRHRAESLSFMRKLEAQGFFCQMCGESDEGGQSGEFFPTDFNRKTLSFSGDGTSEISYGEEQENVAPNDEKWNVVDPDGEERALVITDDIIMAGICKLRKIACIGYCPPESEETGLGESPYFPHVRMVWESFEDREPEELEQFRCRFYGEPVVIARTERLLIRESVSEDFEAIYRMESDMVSEQERCEDRKKICFCSAAGDNRKEKKENCIAEEIICFHEEREKFYSYIKNVYSFYGYGYWTVELVESGREGTVIGRCGLKDYEPGKDDGYVVLKKEAGDGSPQVFPSELFCLELGYIIAKPYRRQGYAYEMCREVLDYAFAVLCADAVVVRIHPQNKASLELARKLGLAGFSFL